MTAKRTTKPTAPVSRPRRVPRTLWVPDTTWRSIGRFITSRSRDLALMAIVAGAFVAVFDGSLYSATTFSFHGWSAIAFAIMPDALMVLSAAKMRQTGISAAQWATAHQWMKIALAFSLATNMIAAFLRNCPAEWINGYVLLTGAVAYHGMIVVFLKGAVDVLTRTRADRKIKTVAVTGTQPVTVAELPVVTRPIRWTETALAWALGTKPPAA